MTIKRKSTKSNRALSLDQIATYQSDFEATPLNRLAMNAISHGEALNVGLNRQVVSSLPMTFSTEIDSGDITHQKKSGRCWMFAALNALRLKGMKKMKLKTFELSESYIMFYDKFERANYFLESILDTLDEAKDSRILMWLLDNPMGDGGQWNMFVNLVEKYGVVPKEIYPESVSSSSTQVMNLHLNEKLREFSSALRLGHQCGKSKANLRTQKGEMLNTIYRMMVIHNGAPPTEFTWAYKDRQGKLHRHKNKITPHEFYRHYIGTDLNDYVSLISCPTKDKPYGKHYTVAFLGNVIGGNKVSYVNIKMSAMKNAVLDCLKKGEAVWFGCDVGKHLMREQGILDANAYQFNLLYSTEFNMDKATRVDYGHSSMTHAMLVTGVHEENGKTVRWKIENSWGKSSGREGFLVMGDTWFDEYVFQVVVPKKFVIQSVVKAIDKDPIVLDPWDPMGSLA